MTSFAGGIEVEPLRSDGWGMDGLYQVTIPHDRRFIAEDVKATVEVRSTPPGPSKIFLVQGLVLGGRRTWVVHQHEGDWLVPTPVPPWVMLAALAVAGQLMPETVWEGLAKDVMEARDP